VVYPPAAAGGGGGGGGGLDTISPGNTALLSATVTVGGGGETQAGASPVYFIAKRWLDAQSGLSVVLPAAYSDPDLEQREYRVQVFTSDVK
jgi:hypothetical protein